MRTNSHVNLDCNFNIMGSRLCTVDESYFPIPSLTSKYLRSPQLSWSGACQPPDPCHDYDTLRNAAVDSEMSQVMDSFLRVASACIELCNTWLIVVRIDPT